MRCSWLLVPIAAGVVACTGSAPANDDEPADTGTDTEPDIGDEGDSDSETDTFTDTDTDADPDAEPSTTDTGTPTCTWPQASFSTSPASPENPFTAVVDGIGLDALEAGVDAGGLHDFYLTDEDVAPRSRYAQVILYWEDGAFLWHELCALAYRIDVLPRDPATVEVADDGVLEEIYDLDLASPLATGCETDHLAWFEARGPGIAFGPTSPLQAAFEEDRLGTAAWQELAPVVSSMYLIVDGVALYSGFVRSYAVTFEEPTCGDAGSFDADPLPVPVDASAPHVRWGFGSVFYGVVDGP